MVWMIFWFSHFLGVSFRKKNKKNKKNENENGVEDIDGAAASVGGAEMVAAQDSDKMTGNMNLVKLKKALDEMTKVKP